MDDRFDNNKASSISEENKEARWDSIHKRGGSRDEIRNQYDGWLEQYPEIAKTLMECKSPILDLGCGIGIDTLHLVEDGHKVVACDFSQEALNKVQENIPEAKTLKFNMKDSLPFSNESFELVIANKSIHYFSEEETKTIISELYRILKPGGKFAFVVNSTNDSNFGAGQGVILEDNFYEVRGTTKRFFDKEDLNKFLDNNHWEFICMNEGEIQNDRVKAVQLKEKNSAIKKITWTCMVRKK